MPEKILSEGLRQEKEEQKNKEPYLPSQQSQETLNYYMRRLNSARDERNQAREEFDGLTYEQDYVANKRAANAYLRPKKNDDEVRIATGTTEKKIEVVYNELIGMNLQHEVRAFDKDDNEMMLLGSDMADIVTRTNEIERDEDFWKPFIKEMLTQRAAFFIEIDDCFFLDGKKPTNLYLMNEGKMHKHEEAKKQPFHRAKKIFLSGLQVYLGDINIPFYRFQEQPYIVLYFRKTYDEGYAKYNGWKNWQYVKPGSPHLADEPYGYRMNKVTEDEIEEIYYIDPINNEYMIIVNGVMMFDEPVSCPWTITPDRRIPMVMAALKDMGTDFAYGKPLTASAKTLQGLADESIRLLVRKFRQAIEPPMATTKKIYSRDIWLAGSITQGLKAEDFQILNPGNQGVTSSEFNFFDLIEKKTEEFIGASSSTQGLAEKGEQTATEIVNQQKQFIKQLGLSVLALMAAKRDACYNRIYNLIENFTKPIGKKIDPVTDKMVNIYKKFTLENGSFENGKRGKKIMSFTDRDLTRPEQEEVYRYERGEEIQGRPTRLRFINIDIFDVAQMWYVAINQKERAGSALDKVMFTDKMNQAAVVAKIAGRQLNGDELINEFENTWQTKNLFQKAAPQPMQPGQENQPNEKLNLMGDLLGKKLNALKQVDESAQTETGDQMEEGAVAGQTNKPSLNTMTSQAM